MEFDSRRRGRPASAVIRSTESTASTAFFIWNILHGRPNSDFGFNVTRSKWKSVCLLCSLFLSQTKSANRPAVYVQVAEAALGFTTELLEALVWYPGGFPWAQNIMVLEASGSSYSNGLKRNQQVLTKWFPTWHNYVLTLIFVFSCRVFLTGNDPLGLWIAYWKRKPSTTWFLSVWCNNLEQWHDSYSYTTFLWAITWWIMIESCCQKTSSVPSLSLNIQRPAQSKLPLRLLVVWSWSVQGGTQEGTREHSPRQGERAWNWMNISWNGDKRNNMLIRKVVDEFTTQIQGVQGNQSFNSGRNASCQKAFNVSKIREIRVGWHVT